MSQQYRFNPLVVRDLDKILREVLFETGTTHPEDISIATEILIEGMKKEAIEQHIQLGMKPDLILLATIDLIKQGRIEKSLQLRAQSRAITH